MRRIIIAAILTVICVVGAGTSFAVNDMPNFGEWMKTNEQQFRKPHRHNGSNMHMDQHISLQRLSIKNGHVSIDGIGVSDDACRKFIAILQQRLSGMECHGTVKADKGIYTFHMDGSKREHHSTNQQDTNDRSPVGDSN